MVCYIQLIGLVRPYSAVLHNKHMFLFPLIDQIVTLSVGSPYKENYHVAMTIHTPI